MSVNQPITRRCLQVALVCCWQSVQAFSQLVATLVAKLPDANFLQPERALVPVEDLEALSDHFYWLLADTIHVGAYEQAKAGLSAIIKRCVLFGKPGVLFELCVRYSRLQGGWNWLSRMRFWLLRYYVLVQVNARIHIFSAYLEPKRPAQTFDQ
jgi:hypothetical protein